MWSSITERPRESNKIVNPNAILVFSAAGPPVSPLGDVVRDAGGDHPGNATR